MAFSSLSKRLVAIVGAILIVQLVVIIYCYTDYSGSGSSSQGIEIGPSLVLKKEECPKLQAQHEKEPQVLHPYSRMVRIRRKSKHPLPAIDPNGYISCYPHSGMNNQRLILEHALITAKILNRTLILPPLYFGRQNIAAWTSFHKQRLTAATIESTNYNRLFFADAMDKEDRKYLYPESALSIVPWSELVNFSAINVRTISLADFVDLKLIDSPRDVMQVRDRVRLDYLIVDEVVGADLEYVFDNTNNRVEGVTFPHIEQEFILQSELCQQGDNIMRKTISGIYTDDSSVREHSFRIQQSDHNADGELQFKLCTTEPLNLTATSNGADGSIYTRIPISKASRMMNLQSDRLKNGPTLIQFGSLFYRPVLTRDENRRALAQITENFVMTHPILSEVTDRVIRKMLHGSTNKELFTLHIRGTDGQFKQQLEEELKKLVNTIKILNSTGQLSQNSAVYIATDIPDPRTNSILAPIRQFLPTFHILSDFEDEIALLAQLVEQDRGRKLKPENITSDWESEMTLLYDQLHAAGVPLDPSHDSKLENFIAKHLTPFVQRHRNKEYAPQPGLLNAEEKKNDGRTRPLPTYGSHWRDLLEVLVCARGRIFIGTRGSSYSVFIMRHQQHYYKKKLKSPDFLSLTTEKRINYPV